MQEQLLDHLQVRLLLECAVEAEDGPRALEAVSGKVELIHRVHCNMTRLAPMPSNLSFHAVEGETYDSGRAS